MDLAHGFQLYSPGKFIPWRITDLQLEDILDGKPLKKIKPGYYTLECEPLQGLQCILGFHLHRFDVLTELEFFKNMMDLDEIPGNYQDFQQHFENVFGKPSKTENGKEGFPSHEWLVSGVRIVHFVFDRFGPEEHLLVTKI